MNSQDETGAADGPSHDLTRREFLSGTGSAAVSLVPGQMIAGFGGSDGVLTPLALSLPDAGVMHSSDIPSWHIEYKEGSADSLREWVRSSDDRKIIREHSSKSMTVKAPLTDVGVQTLGIFRQRTRLTDGLRTQSYVKTIDRNIRVSYADPIGVLQDQSVWGFDISTLDLIQMSIASTSTPSPDGVAFDGDASETTMDQHKSDLGADAVSVDSSDLTIGVIDTGVNGGAVFEDSTGTSRILDESKNFITGETVRDAGLDAIADGNHHGTWCASCIAARAPTTDQSHHEGYLPKASILGLKALDDEGSGSTSNIADAIEYATDKGCDAICLSLGSPMWSEQLNSSLKYAAENGTVPVAAAGNDRFGSTWTATPADSEWAIAVSASTVGSAEERQSAYFANIGPDPGTSDFSDGETSGAVPDLAAPGMKTTALLPSGTKTLSGTSMAGPNVVGVVGLLKAAEGGLSYQEVYDRLTNYHQPLPKIAENEAAYGAPDIERAINKTPPDKPQSEAMTDTAENRSTSYEGYSNASGGILY